MRYTMNTPAKTQQVLPRALSDRSIASIQAGAALTAHATPLQGSIQVQMCAANTPIAQLLLVLPTTAQPDPSLRETTIPSQPIYPNEQRPGH